MCLVTDGAEDTFGFPAILWSSGQRWEVARAEPISSAAQVIAYFNYINRIADCLGVDLEPEMLQDK